MEYQTFSPFKIVFVAKGAIYCLAITTMIVSRVKITCHFYVPKYVSVRKLTWYVIVVYIKNGIYFIIYYFKRTDSPSFNGANIDVGAVRTSVFDVNIR